MTTLTFRVGRKGSSKSGNYGHAGRPGRVGGSAPRSTGAISFTKANEDDEIKWREAYLDSVQLSKVELSALYNYVGAYYIDVNETLRNNETPRKAVVDIISRLDSAMERSSVPETVMVHRGFATDRTDKFKVGDTFVDNGFVSTSFLENIAKSFAFGNGESGVMLHIRVGKGSKALPSATPGEAEMILNRGSKFKITGAYSEDLGDGDKLKHYNAELLQ